MYRLMIDPRELPTGTGVYIFRDEGGRPLYVGKARNIRNRVSQHLKSSDMKERRLCSRASSVECILTRGEMEAALLEERLIKEMTPPFNVELKDDKSYPYLLLTTHQRFPGLFLVRGFKGRQGKLFGPYSGVKDLRVALRYLRALFPVRNCWVLRRRNKPCMEAHLGRCTAPCTG
ncbi:MAG: excinuclease ABC subunit C, partial [Thermoplasmata archaeon]